MAFYGSSEQFITCAQALFDRLLSVNPAAAEPVEKARLLVRFRCTDPAAIFVINGRRHPPTVRFGEDRIRPEIAVETQTDTIHQIMLGELGLSKALSANLLRVRGSVWKVVSLADLFQECQLLYPGILREQGLLK